MNDLSATNEIEFIILILRFYYLFTFYSLNDILLSRNSHGKAKILKQLEKINLGLFVFFYINPLFNPLFDCFVYNKQNCIFE